MVSSSSSWSNITGNVNDINPENYFVGMVDILGFKQLFNEKNFEPGQTAIERTRQIHYTMGHYFVGIGIFVKKWEKPEELMWNIILNISMAVRDLALGIKEKRILTQCEFILGIV